jgi:hypothetical protein
MGGHFIATSNPKSIRLKLWLAIILFLAFVIVILTSCGDTYRYPCQDPAKSNSAECQCGLQPRTKNKALNAVESNATTTTLHLLAGFDC